MTAKEADTKRSWVDPDEPPEWPDEAWARARFSVGGKVVRPADGTLTRRGRPPVGEAAKQQVTLRLAPKVLEHFKAEGTGWQTRINAVLERHVSGTLPEHRRSRPRAIQGGVHAMAKGEQTGKKAGTAASKVLRSGSTGKDSKTAAGFRADPAPRQEEIGRRARAAKRRWQV